MKLSVSNIAWAEEKDKIIYELMKDYNFSGLEIAPTRVFPERPYDDLKKAESWAKSLKDSYGFAISSMQSIWFGRQEKVFASAQDRESLVAYTKKAVDFAKVIGCKNLVFGCPKNRNIDEGMVSDCEIDFFKEIGDYAKANNTVIGMEANPTIYGTNYINGTVQALDLIKKVNSEGFKLNLDLGTIIQNEETLDCLKENASLINHVHISEPFLKPIEKRKLHNELAAILKQSDYQGFVSIEMGKQDDIAVLQEIMSYIREIF